MPRAHSKNSNSANLEGKFGVGPKSNDWCPYKKKRSHRETHREGDGMKMEAEIGEMCLQAKGHQGLLATIGTLRGRIHFTPHSRRKQLCQHFVSDFWPSAL